MASISEPSLIGVQNASKPGFKKVVNSRWTFVALQGFDLLTTLIAFHMGALEANPLVAHLVATFGGFRGVVISKLFAIAIAMGVRKRIWVVNIFYAVIILPQRPRVRILFPRTREPD